MEQPIKRFLIVGGGKMGEAILRGWASSTYPPADAISVGNLSVVEPGAERRAFLEREVGVTCYADVRDVALQDAPDVVLLAVKPQVMASVLENIAACAPFQGGTDGPLFVSIAAGVTTATLEAALPAGSAVVRVMPNMPLSIGAGASGVCAGKVASAEQAHYVEQLFSCLGRAVVVPESNMDAVCAVSGSGPAYVIALVESLRDAGVAEGLPAETAEALALQTVLGTARLADESASSLADIRASICSPGGTTIAALDAMHAAGFDEVFRAGVHAAVERSKELAQCT